MDIRRARLHLQAISRRLPLAAGVCAFALTSVLSLKPNTAHVAAHTEHSASADTRVVANRMVHKGLASYYAPYFHGRLTASGTRFDNTEMLAAHPSIPFGTVVRVTNLTNGRSVRVRVVDRGPARAPRREGVVIDVSHAAARALGFVERGRVPVRLEVVRRPRESGRS